MGTWIGNPKAWTSSGSRDLALRNNAIIRQMLEVSGAFPKKFATGGEFSAKHFNSEGGL